MTLAILLFSLFLMLGSARMVAQDTLHAITDAAQRMRSSGQVIQRTSFVTLWVMIFALSYM